MLLLTLQLTACASDRAGDPVPAAGPEADAAPARRTSEGFVGLEYPPFPEGVEHRGATLIVAPGERISDAAYGFEEVRAGDRHLLWLSRITRYDDEGTAYWQVLDVAELPPASPGERLMLNCLIDGRAGVAAIVLEEEQEVLTNVRQAWRADRDAGRLQPIGGEGVTCKNLGFHL